MSQRGTKAMKITRGEDCTGQETRTTADREVGGTVFVLIFRAVIDAVVRHPENMKMESGDLRG